MATYSFKSSGTRLDDVEQQKEVIKQSPLPIGIKTPIELGTSDNDGILAMHYELKDQISDNLRNLIQTNWGERLGLYDYGANLQPIVTEFVTDENFDKEAMNRISTAIAKWMPFITPITFTSEIDRFNNKNTAIVNITLTYTIPIINNDERKIEVTLYVI